MTITAGALLLAFLSYRETQQLRVENQTLRVKLGALDIKDPKKMYARAAETLGDREWRWRFYVPRKHWFRLHTILEKIPISGLIDGNSGSFELDAGEYEIQVAAKKGKAGICDVVIVPPKGRTIFSIEEAHAQWIIGGSFDTSGVTETTSEYEPGNPIEFLRLRQSMKISNGSMTDPNPCDGLLIWMQEIADPNAAP